MCKAQSPRCPNCPLTDLCRFFHDERLEALQAGDAPSIAKHKGQ
ncbi:MAG TPA: hypothetical protein VKU00_20685 [Chthonomonadaceae bacterium]|nr:hypothetical protein [Chthonomonadaceae bacterium]